MRHTGRRMMIFLLALAIGYSPIAPADTTPNTVSLQTLVDGFIKRHENDDFNYELTADELAKSIEQAKGSTVAVFDDQAKKVLKQLQAPDSSQEAFKREVKRQATQADADLLFANLVNEVESGKRKISDLNMLVLDIRDAWVFKPEQAAIYNFLADAINDYHYSEAQMADLRVKAQAEYRTTRDQIWTYKILLIAGALGVLRYGPSALKPYFPWLFKDEAVTAAKSAAKAAANDIGTAAFEKAAAKAASGDVSTEEFDQLVKWLRTTSPAEAVVPSQLRLAVQNVSRTSVMKSIAESSPVTFMKKYGLLTNVKAAAGAYALGRGVGGVDNLGHILYDHVVGENINNTYINTAQLETGKNLKSDYYDGLAVLNLACRTRELAESTSKPLSADAHLDAVKKLSGYYVQYLVYKDYAPRYSGDKVLLPAEVRADADTGVVSYSIPVAGPAVGDHFQCDLLKGSAVAPRVETSLPESLFYLMLTFNQLKAADVVAPPAPNDKANAGAAALTGVQE